jgi:hypothetical protein
VSALSMWADEDGRAAHRLEFPVYARKCESSAVFAPEISETTVRAYGGDGRRQLPALFTAKGTERMPERHLALRIRHLEPLLPLARPPRRIGGSALGAVAPEAMTAERTCRRQPGGLMRDGIPNFLSRRGQSAIDAGLIGGRMPGRSGSGQKTGPWIGSRRSRIGGGLLLLGPLLGLGLASSHVAARDHLIARVTGGRTACRGCIAHARGRHLVGSEAASWWYAGAAGGRTVVSRVEVPSCIKGEPVTIAKSVSERPRSAVITFVVHRPAGPSESGCERHLGLRPVRVRLGQSLKGLRLYDGSTWPPSLRKAFPSARPEVGSTAPREAGRTAEGGMPMLGRGSPEPRNSIAPSYAGTSPTLRADARSRVTLDLQPHRARAGTKIRFRLWNDRASSVGFVDEFWIQQSLDGSHWRRASFSPRGPWYEDQHQILPGDHAPWERFHIPPDAAPGSYRIVKAILDVGATRYRVADFRVVG